MEDLTDYQIKALLEHITPIFTGEARHRLKLLRMALKLDQRQLAKLLGVGVATISNAENGAKSTRNPILISKLISVFGPRGVVYILTGKYAQAFEERAAFVHSEYWAAKHAAQGNRTPWKERYRYDEKTKYELVMENEKLRKMIKESVFTKTESEDNT